MFTVRSFLKAADRGDTVAVKEYLSRRDAAECIKGTDGEGNTALHLAAQSGHVETLKALIEGGCTDVAALNDAGYTPLVKAILGGQPAVVPVLLNAGVDVNANITHWETALKMAVTRNTPAIVSLLLESGADPNKGNPLVAALEHYNWTAAEALLNAGADPNAGGPSRYRPLHYAVQYGQENLAKIALEKGADVNAQADYGNTPLHLAIDHNNDKIAKMLLDRGARIDIQNTHSQDAVAAAARNRNAAGIAEMIAPIARAAIAKRTNALNATAAEMPDGDADAWVLMGEQKVAHVSVHPVLFRRLTEVFNFEARERFIISENMKTQAENVTAPVSFDQTPERHLQAAVDNLRRLGGHAEDEDVFGTRMPKKSLKPAG